MLAQILAEVAPDVIYHLAGLPRGDDLAHLLSVNALGTESLLQAASQLSEPPRVVIPGSAAEYGLLATDAPVDETTPLRPISAYGVSKAAQTLLGQSYALRGQVPVIIGRVFNIVGPGEPSSMVCGHVASQIAACEAGQAPPMLKIGSLSATRDFLDVRDAVRALSLAGVPRSSGRGVQHLQRHRLPDGRRCPPTGRVVCVAYRAACLIPPIRRPADVPHCVGDFGRLRAATGFEPAIPLAQSLRDVLAWWRQVQDRGGAPR